MWRRDRYSPERSGGLPAAQLVEICFSGKYSLQEVKTMLAGKGGMVAYLETNNFQEAGRRAGDGDELASLIVKGCSYQVAKEIGAMSAVLSGEVDAIILTGGLAYDRDHVESITSMVKSIAPVFVYPGEDELKALAYNGFLAVYSPEVIDKELIVRGSDESNKASSVGTMSYMPAAFGIVCASVVIRNLAGITPTV